MRILQSPSFKRAYKKTIRNNPELEARFWENVKLFTENPFAPQLKTHKLSGKLKELWSFTVAYDCRVVFYFVNNEVVEFVDIGRHADVY